MPPKSPRRVDYISAAIGQWGRYQLCIFILICLVKTAIGLNQLSVVFMTQKIDFKCDNVTNKCPCDNPEFDHSIFKTTLITEYKLICETFWMKAIYQSLFQLGVTIGSMYFGGVADKYGRLKPLLVCCLGMFAVGLTATVLYNFWVFTFARFLVGIFVGGIQVTSFVIVIEFIDAKYRDTIGNFYHLPFVFGHLLLPLYSYFIREYRKLLIAIALSSLPQISYIFLKESPKWLLAKGKDEEAIKVLEWVAKRNKRDVAAIRPLVEKYRSESKLSTDNKSWADLFKTPNIRKRNLLMGMIWFSASYGYYGLSQLMGHLQGDIFINVAFSALLAFGGCVFGMPFIWKLSRKILVMFADLTTAGVLLLFLFLEEGVGRVICGSIGVMCMFFKFCVIYLFCGEMFPTVIRNAAIGYASMTARLGAVVAPFALETKHIKEWLAPLLFALVPMVSAYCVYLLPETKGIKLMDTIEEGEAFVRLPSILSIQSLLSFQKEEKMKKERAKKMTF